jgi:hypothetical protein
MDTKVRIERAQRIRAAVANPVSLVDAARHVLAQTPLRCTHLVAFCSEGHAVAAAASALALAGGRELAVARASHLEPLHRGPGKRAWRWISVEEALGAGPVRPWVVQWAEDRGGGQPLHLEHVAELLAEVA